MQTVHIGIFPPPIGGVSVHFYRRSKIEKDALFIDSREIKGFIRFRYWIIKQIFDPRKKNYICHLSSYKTLLGLHIISYFSKHKFSLVLHGNILINEYKRANVFKKFWMKTIFNNAHSIIVVNPDFKKFLRSIGINDVNITVKNAYIPPPLEEESNIFKTYNLELLEYLKKRKPIIIANAHAIEFYNGQDLYGLDMCVELTKLLKRDYPNLGFLFALANKNLEIAYLKKIKKRIKELNIEKNFLFMIGQKELWPILKKGDLMVRPTNIDGDSISIREAHFFKLPVVTSDVVLRPKNCYLFKNRDLNDFYVKCKDILKKL